MMLILSNSLRGVSRLLLFDVTAKSKGILGEKEDTIKENAMSHVETLELAIKQLSPGELAAFRTWFIEFDAAEWDRQIEMDSKTARLDRLAQSALEEHKAGKTKLI